MFYVDNKPDIVDLFRKLTLSETIRTLVFCILYLDLIEFMNTVVQACPSLGGLYRFCKIPPHRK